MANENILLGHLTKSNTISDRSRRKTAAQQVLTLLWPVFVILCSSELGFATSGQSITFDAPGAGTVANLGTFAYAINDLGEVIGYSVDDKVLYHGFVRYPGGMVQTVDAPGGGTVAGSQQGTVLTAINNEGTISGQYQDSIYVYHAFVYGLDGRFVIFDAPGAGSGPNQGTLAQSINSEGTTVGEWIDKNNVGDGFSRSREGVFTSFDAPKAGTVPNQVPDQGTFVSPGPALSPFGVAIGQYIDAKGVIHGFVRRRGGAITSIDPSGSITTYAEGINPEGAIVGTFKDNHYISHGFLRDPRGEITRLDVPGFLDNTNAKDITPFGVIVGLWNDSNNVYHGFLRYPNGALLKFDVPGAGSVPESAQGTIPVVINVWGEVAGFIQDSSNVYHGFIRLP